MFMSLVNHLERASGTIRDYAVAVKIADRISNTESTLATGNEGLIQMYSKEHSEFSNLMERFRAPWHTPLLAELNSVWSHIP